MATPVGHWLVLQRSAWMQPSANIIARAALHMSAPSATLVAIWKPVFTLPDAIRRIWSRRPAPTSALCTNDEPLVERRADRIGELERRRAGAALAAVDGDEVGHDARLQHRLDDAEELVALADAQLEADRLAARGLAQLSAGTAAGRSACVNAVCAGGETTSWPSTTPRISTISGVSFAAGRMPPCPGLAPCDSLTSIIFTLGSVARVGERVGIEVAVRRAAAEVAGADLPDQIAAGLEVIRAQAAFAGVVREAADLRAGVEREDRVLAERAVAHRRHVEDRRRVRLRACGAADDRRGCTPWSGCTGASE